MRVERNLARVSEPSVALGLADWRFLLPGPHAEPYDHLVLLGAAPGLAQRLIDLAVADNVTHALPRDPTADAVVVLNGERVPLPAIGQCLRPGGVLYLEVDRHAAGGWAAGPRQVCRALRNAGLTPLQTYAVWPGFGQRRTYLPLEVPAAFHWYVSTRRAAHTARSTVLEAAVKALLAVNGGRAATWVPSFAIVAVAGAVQCTRPALLLDSSVSAVLGPGDYQMVLLTHGGDRAVVMPFRSRDRWPAAVLKIPRLPSFNDRTANEQQVLSSMAQSLDARLRESVPRPLGLFPYGNVSVAVESFRPGTPLVRRTRQWGRTLQGKVSDLHAAASWIGNFHCQTEISRGPWSAADTERWIERPTEAYRQAFGATESEKSLFARARTYAGSLAGAPFPVVWQHRDFKPNHVFRSGRMMTVIDWEGARPGPPLCDLLHFLVHWHGSIRGSSGFSSVSRLFFESDGPDAVSRAVSDAVREYMRVLRIDGGFFPLLLLYTCVELVLRRAEQQQLQEEAGEHPRGGNQNFELIAVLARHVDELFLDDRFHAYAR